MLFNRCNHHWEEVSRTFQPAIKGVRVQNIQVWGSRAAVHGFTSIELRCPQCGELRVKAFIGKIGAARLSDQ